MIKRKRSQKDRLLDYLLQQEGRAITRLESFNKLGIVELSARIIELENEGYVFHKPRIKVKNRFKETVRVTAYSLHGKHFKRAA